MGTSIRIRRLPARCLFRQVASKLYVTLNTVKAHTRNIYGKLDVHSRTQAVMRARTLGLLSTE